MRLCAGCSHHFSAEMLIEWATVSRDRDNRVRTAAAAGVTR